NSHTTSSKKGQQQHSIGCTRWLFHRMARRLRPETGAGRDAGRGPSADLALPPPKEEKSMRRFCVSWLSVFLLGTIGVGPLPAQQADWALRDEAVKTLKKAASFYRNQVASHGGYVYYYSVDLKQRWGEGKASADTIFVQPPGTPAVGMAYLKAYAPTGDSFYLDAARETAAALVNGQLESGG